MNQTCSDRMRGKRDLIVLERAPGSDAAHYRAFRLHAGAPSPTWDRKHGKSLHALLALA